MCLANVAAAEQTSGKASEFSDKAITSSPDPAEKYSPFLLASLGFHRTNLKTSRHRGLPSFSMFYFYFPKRISKHMLYLSQMEKACSLSQLYSSADST